MKPLTKEEMKQILGGYVAISNSGCGQDCSGTSCITNDSNTTSGTCYASSAGKCYCVAVY